MNDALGKGAAMMLLLIPLIGCGGGSASDFPSWQVTRSSVRIVRDERQDIPFFVFRSPEDPLNSTTTFSVEGLPSGTTATFDPTSFTFSGSSAGQGVLHIDADRTATTGKYDLSVRRTRGTGFVTKHVTLSVVDFAVNVGVNKHNVTLSPGGSETVDVTLTRRGNSSGSVELDLGGHLPDGVTYSFDPERVVVDPDHPQVKAKLKLSADGNASTSATETCFVKALKGTNRDDSDNITVELSVPEVTTARVTKKRD